MGRITVTSWVVGAPSGPNIETVFALYRFACQNHFASIWLAMQRRNKRATNTRYWRASSAGLGNYPCGRATALSVTLSGGALFANWELFRPLSSLIATVILAIYIGRASAQHANPGVWTNRLLGVALVGCIASTC